MTFFDSIGEVYRLTKIGELFVNSSKKDRSKLFGEQCKKVKVFNLFLDKVDNAGEAGISSRLAESTVLEDLKIDLAETTLDKLGNILANWAEYAGIISRKGRVCKMKKYIPKQITLFEVIDGWEQA